MRINGKNLRGLFLYEPSVTYERGDFVIEDSMIYNCNAESTGEKPSSSANFSPYMAGEIATAEEVLEGKGTDKYVSIESLVRILDNYYSGFNAAGIITNEISGNGEIALKDMFGNNLSFSSPSYTDPLDTIIHSTINNGIFKVAREVVVGILGNGNEDTILRQFSYTENGELHRTQELIDEENGHILFRHLVGTGKPSSWKSSIIDNDIVRVVNDIRTYYEGKLTELDKEKERLVNCFRFEEVDDDYSYTDGDKLTFTIKETTKEGLVSMKSSTVTVSRDGQTYYYLVGKSKVSVTCSTSGNLVILGATVVDKYIRKKYTRL